MEADNSSKDYEVLGVIGSGSFGLIRKVIRKRDNMVRQRSLFANTGVGTQGNPLHQNV